MIGRLLWDKGVGEYIDAAWSLKAHVPDVHFQLLSPLRVQNHTTIDEHLVSGWVQEGIIEYLGEVDDIQNYVKKASCVVLPSYREGTSRVLLEAVSVGRPIVATNVPGCREVVAGGINRIPVQ